MLAYKVCWSFFSNKKYRRQGDVGFLKLVRLKGVQPQRVVISWDNCCVYSIQGRSYMRVGTLGLSSLVYFSRFHVLIFFFFHLDLPI